MTTTEHDVIAAAVVSEVDDLPEETKNLVESHMGPWAEGKLPETPNEMCFHFADSSAANDNHRSNVYFPAQELQDEFSHIEAIAVEEDEVI